MDSTNSILIPETDMCPDLFHVLNTPTQFSDEVAQEFSFEQISVTESKNTYNGQSDSSPNHETNFEHQIRQQNNIQAIATSPICSSPPPHSTVQNYQLPYFINQAEPQFLTSKDPVLMADIILDQQPPHIGSTIMKQSQPQAHISIIRTSSGVSRAIVKRKHKRTAFTTDQVAFLEDFFRNKPYITREERKKLSKVLQVNDTSVKIWFQNRRMKVKRENDPVLYYSSETPSEFPNNSHYADIPIEILVDDAAVKPINYESTQITNYFTNNQVFSNISENPIMYPEYSTEDNETLACATSNISDLDYIESQINQNPDENGYITLNESTVSELFNILDSFVPDDMDLVLPSSETKDVTTDFENTFYEPISPANHSECSINEEESRWEPVEPKAPLQHLFDLRTLLLL